MEPDDREVSEVCAHCGASISGDRDRSFAFGDENVLCWTCATARGGSYDDRLDEWVRAPDLGGLGDEAYGASPHEVRRGRR